MVTIRTIFAPCSKGMASATARAAGRLKSQATLEAWLVADGDHRYVAQPSIFGDDVGHLGVLARLDDVLVGDPASLSGALEGLDEGAGIGDALAVLGGDQPFDAKQRWREHGAGPDDDFER